MEPTEKKRKFPVKIVVLILVVASVVYFGPAVYFHSHFLPSTTLNGMSVSGKTQKQVEDMITEEIDRYALQIETRGETEVLNGADISLAPEFGDSILNCMKAQNPYIWPAALFSSQELEEETIVSFDKEKLESKADEFSFMLKKNQKSPKDAYCSDYSEDGYKIIPEELGSKIKRNQLVSTLSEAVNNLKETVSLEETDCYVKPNVTSEDETLKKVTNTLNQYTGVTLTYRIGEKKETLDGSVTHEWMRVNGSEVTIDEEAVKDYADSLASSYNTVFRKHTLNTSYQKTVDITAGDYGWKVDKEGEKEQILKDIKAGKSLERELIYSQTANSHGEHDYGDTYVEINLTAQHLFFYKNGSLIVESDFVSGNLSKNYDTPTGIYGLTYKQEDAVLRGENYASPVDYWMPYCNNVGMHDASWNRKSGCNCARCGESR